MSKLTVIKLRVEATLQKKVLVSSAFNDFSLALQLLSFVAENERINIRERQASGIAAAKKRGVRFGRPPFEIPPDYEKYYLLWKNKKLSAKEAAEACGMPLWAFYKKGKTLGFH